MPIIPTGPSINKDMHKTVHTAIPSFTDRFSLHNHIRIQYAVIEYNRLLCHSKESGESKGEKTLLTPYPTSIPPVISLSFLPSSITFLLVHTSCTNSLLPQDLCTCCYFSVSNTSNCRLHSLLYSLCLT